MDSKENRVSNADSERSVRKDTNPKDSVGVRKVPFSTVPFPVVAEIGLAMLEGARKYGRHNYREAGVRASVYFDAAIRHLSAWWEGQDIDPDSGLPHIVKAMATLAVLRDSQLMGNWVDDRPPVHNPEWVTRFNKTAGEIIDRYPEAKEAFTQLKTIRLILANDPLYGSDAQRKESVQRDIADARGEKDPRAMTSEEYREYAHKRIRGIGHPNQEGIDMVGKKNIDEEKGDDTII